MDTNIFSYSFMLRAFIAGSLIAVIAPLIGSFLVMRKYSLIADTLSHIALSGVALGLILHTQPLLTTVLITVTAALIIERLRTSIRISADAILAMFLPGGLAISLIFISMAQGFNSNLFSYLFGSITTVQQDELLLMALLALITIVSVISLYKQLLFTSLDTDSARISGIPVNKVNTLLVVLTAITVSLSMRIVGILLVGALMVIPVVTATQVARSFFQTLLVAIVFACIAVIAGLFISFYADLPAGAVIVLSSLGLFVGSVILKKR